MFSLFSPYILRSPSLTICPSSNAYAGSYATTAGFVAASSRE